VEDWQMQPTADEPRPAANLPTVPLPEQIGRYHILERLGAGGMGTVYKAQDPQLNRIVALKVPRFDGPPQDVAKRMQRFQREARAAAQVWHPHVCPIFDVGEHEGQPFVVMACVEGQSLAKRLAEKGRYEDVAEAVAVVRQILDALDAVHAHGITHRDVKPGNILLEPGGRAILTDFGLARPEADAEHLTSEGAIVGTPAYMAPEQAAGQAERIGPWTDSYSLGVVLYQMLTGRLPFEGTPLAILSKITQEAPPPPSRWRADLDAALEAIVLKALDKEPTRRYQRARQFAEALDEWSPSSGRTVATQVPARDPIWEPSHYRTAAFFSALVRCLLLLVGCGMGGGACYLYYSGYVAAAFILFISSMVAFSTITKISTLEEQELLRLLQGAESGNRPKVEGAVVEGANVNAKDSMGETALMKAAANGHRDIVKILVANGADVNLENPVGQTATMLAAAKGHSDIVELLRAARAKK
jgi:hypothetical protein